MEKYKGSGIYGEGDVYVLRSLDDWNEYEKLQKERTNDNILKWYPGFYQIKESFKKYIGKTWKDKDNSSLYKVVAIEDNTPWSDWYWVVQNIDDERDVKHILANSPELREGITLSPEEKEMLYRELGSRLVYPDLKVRWNNEDFEVLGLGFGRVTLVKPFMSATSGSPLVEEVRLLLRPISSMTEEEMDKLFDILYVNKEGKDEDWIKINDALGIEFFLPSGRWVEDMDEALNYLRSIHIDINGMIEKGLAYEI